MARKMKDSGIEWIGEIPEGWSVSKVLHYLSMPITDGPHTTPILYDTGIPFVSAEAVSCGNGRIDFSHIRGYISEKFYKECCQKYIPEIDDIYMIKSGATTGRVAIVDTTKVFTIWSPLAVFRCNKDCMLPKFLFYYLQSPAFQKEVEFGWTFGTQQNVGMRSLEQMKVCVPPLNKQGAIANHLDYQCAQIDLLLQKALTSIDEYKKVKQAVITQAVTKGVRGEREMKDSGVEWIGKVPKEWDVRKLKAVSARINVGVVIRPSEYFDDNGTVPFLRGINVKEYTISSENMVYISQTSNRALSKSQVRTGDILIVRDGNIGASCVVPSCYNGANVVSMVIVTPNNNCDSRFLCYSLNSEVGKTQFTLTKIGSALTHTSVSAVSDILSPVPSREEQYEIADYLDAKCAEIDGLIAKKEQLVKELESYKKSLIYEIVTGKREV